MGGLCRYADTSLHAYDTTTEADCSSPSRLYSNDSTHSRRRDIAVKDQYLTSMLYLHEV